MSKCALFINVSINLLPFSSIVGKFYKKMGLYTKMSHELIEVPDYVPKEVLYILEIDWQINDRPRGSTSYPIYFYNNYKEIKGKISKILLKFIFKTNISDPLDFLKKIRDKYPNLRWNKFIIEEKERFILKRLPQNMESFSFTIKYWRIREPIISYIEQSIGKLKELEELKSLFSTRSKLSFEEYLERKTKMLLSLDLTEWEKNLKKPLPTQK